MNRVAVTSIDGQGEISIGSSAASNRVNLGLLGLLASKRIHQKFVKHTNI